MSDIYIYARSDVNPEMFVVKKEDSAPYGYSIERVGEYFGKIFPGDYLLIQDENVVAHELVPAEATHENLVERAKEVMGTPAVYVRTAEYDEFKKIAVFFKRKELNDLFKEFAFGKIMSLDVFLWKALRSRGFDQGIIGILTEYFAYARNTKREQFEELALKKDTALRLAEREIWRDIIRAETAREYPKLFITDLDLNEFLDISEKEKKELKIDELGYDEIYSIISEDIDSSVLDTVSDNYNAKIYRFALNVASIILFILSVTFFYQWFVNKSKNMFYDMKIEKLQKETKEIEKRNDAVRKSIVYDKYKPFDFGAFMKKIDSLSAYGGAITGTSYKIDSKGNVEVSVKMKGIENVKKFVRERKEKRIRVSKKGDSFLLVYRDRIGGKK